MSIYSSYKNKQEKLKGEKMLPADKAQAKQLQAAGT